MIYIIRINNQDIIKIGYTASNKSLIKRIKAIQTGNPFTLTVESTFGGSRLKERYLHDQCKSRHMSGEWFRLTKEEVKRLTTKYRDWSPTVNGVTHVSDISHTIKKDKLQKSNHFPAVRNKVDEEKLKALWQKGSEAWIDVHNPAEWVETMRDDPPWKQL